MCHSKELEKDLRDEWHSACGGSIINVESIIAELRDRGLIRESPPERYQARQRGRYGDIAWRTPEESERATASDFDSPKIELPRLPLRIIDVDDFDSSGFSSCVADQGTDALAWYNPYHYFGLKSWGIHIPEDSIYYVAKEVLGNFPSDPRTLQLRLRASFLLLFRHEFFHFLTEIGASVLELEMPSPARDVYNNYDVKVYSRPTQPTQPLEEALANARSYSSFKHSPIGRELAGINANVISQIEHFMDRQPPGYSDYKKYDRHFTLGRRELAACLCTGSSGARPLEPLEILLGPNSADVRINDVPLYIRRTVHPKKSSSAQIWY